MGVHGDDRVVRASEDRTRPELKPEHRPGARRPASVRPASGTVFQLEAQAESTASAWSLPAMPSALDPTGSIPGGRPRSTPRQCLPVAAHFELDLTARELRDGLPVHLRPKEFLLLAILAANPGRAFSRRQLLDMAWDPERDIDPRTVDVHVHWLRSKIEAAPRRPAHLVTVRGFGYRLDPDAR